MTTVMNDEKVSPEEVSRFLAEYSSSLWSCGSTCIRITKNVVRIANRLGYHADIMMLPKHVTVSVVNNNTGEYAQYTSYMGQQPVNYNTNASLSRLSWKIADGKISFGASRKAMQNIFEIPRYKFWTVLCLVVCANASFCRLFGGDIMAMGIVAFATLIGFTIKTVMSWLHIDARVGVILASYISAVIGTGGYIFDCTSTPDIALGTSVLYLIPGIPYINSVTDMIDGHYLCFFSRLMQALILTACIAAGLTLGFLTMNLNVF